MQDPMAAAFHGAKPQFPEPEQQQLKCPRCESTNTKFCYYNNYNLSQPRHFCKNCRRYWTKGGALRNIPIGGGSRKNSKRTNSSSSSSSSANPKRPSTSSSDPPNQIPKPEPMSVLYPTPVDPDDKMLEITGSFSSLLQSNGHFGNLLESYQTGESGVGGLPDSSDLNRSMQSSNDSSGSENPPPPPLPENFLGLTGDSSCWAGGWPDLAIYTPGSSFQ